MPFPLRTRTRGRPSRNAGVVNVAAAPSFNPLTDWTTDPVHGVWASDPLWTPPADAGAVSSWRNGGSVGGDLVQATGAKQPTYRASTAAFNNKPTVQFDGTDDVLFVDVADFAQPFSFVAVAQAPVNTGTGYIMNGQNAGLVMMGFLNVNTWQIRGGTELLYTPVSTNPQLHVGVFDGASSKAGVNGALASGNAGTNGFTGWVVGAYSTTPALPFPGHIALALVFAGDVTAQAEWATFKAWVTSTYGITVA